MAANYRQLAEKFMQGVSTNDRKTYEEVCAPDFEHAEPGLKGRGIDSWVQYNQPFKIAFPDVHVRIVNFVLSGDEVAFELEYAGKHTGPLQGPQGSIPASNRSINIRGGAFLRFRDDKIVRFHGYFDQVEMMQQIGTMPSPAGASA